MPIFCPDYPTSPSLFSSTSGFRREKLEKGKGAEIGRSHDSTSLAREGGGQAQQVCSIKAPPPPPPVPNSSMPRFGGRCGPVEEAFRKREQPYFSHAGPPFLPAASPNAVCDVERAPSRLQPYTLHGGIKPFPSPPFHPLVPPPVLLLSVSRVLYVLQAVSIRGRREEDRGRRRGGKKGEKGGFHPLLSGSIYQLLPLPSSSPSSFPLLFPSPHSF